MIERLQQQADQPSGRGSGDRASSWAVDHFEGGSARVLLELLGHSVFCGRQLVGIRPVANGPSQP